MKKKLFQAAGLFATAVLAVVLTGCGAKKAAPSGSTSTAGTKSPITFSLFNADATEDMIFNDPVAQKITELTGITLTVDYPVGGDTQAVPLMIASGEYPDLIYAKGDLDKLIEAGAVLKLDDFIEQKGTNIKKLYGDQLVRLKTSIEDPSIYSVGTYGVRSGQWTTNGSMQIQHAVLKELGYPPMKTLEDYEKAIKAYIAKYPAIDGQKTIGISLLIDTWQWMIDLANPSNYLIGWPDDGQWIVDPNTLQAQYKFQHPQADLYFRWLTKMHAEGLLDPESFTQKEDIWKAKIASGRVLAIAYPNWGYNDARTSLINEGKPERTYAYLPITADSRFKSPMLKYYGYSGGWGIAISKNCKDPERAFEFLDWMSSEQAQILTNWGIEGVNYQVENGKRIIPPEEQRRSDTDPDYGKKTGVGRWAYPFPQMGSAVIDSTGNYITRDSPERIKATYLPVEKETLAAYGVEMWTDLFPSPDELGVSRHGQAWQYALPPDINAIVTEANDLSKVALTNLVLSKPEDFDAGWKKLQDDLIAIRIETANAALSKLVKDKIQMWGN